MEVAVALMPAPRFVIVACGEAERPGRLEVEDVEVVRTSPDLDQKPAAPILDPQHALVDLRLRATLVQLLEAHDRVAQCRDVVDTMKHPMLAGLGLEDD